MLKCNFDNSIEIALWQGCSPVIFLHIQVCKKEKNWVTVCRKNLTTMVGQVERLYLFAGMDNVNC